MPTPSERLQKIISALTPSEAVFKVVQSKGDSLILESVITKKASTQEIPEDRELQEAVSSDVREQWDADEGKFVVTSTVDVLWNKIKNTIIREYEEISTRCDATKRKTQHFIRDIKIDDRHLPNYLIQVFLKIHSPAYDAMTTEECEPIFEQFESLRRTYGKRNR